MKLDYIQVESRAVLSEFLDELIVAVSSLIRRTGDSIHSPEWMLHLMASFVGRDDCYLLIGVDKERRLVGFLFGVLIADKPPWVDIMSLWSKPGVASQLKHEVFEMLAAWGRERGATRISAAITRSPKNFYRFFYKSLGFRPVGVLIEANIGGEKCQIHH